MSKIILFILWFIYLIILTYKGLCKSKNNIKSIEFINIIMFIIFWFYKNNAISKVLPYLYLVVLITSIIMTLLTLKDFHKKFNFQKRDLLYYIPCLIGLVVIIYLYENVYRFAFVMFITTLIDIIWPIIIYLTCKLIYKKNK